MKRFFWLLAPIVVYFVLDSLFGTLVAVVCSSVIPIAQFVYSLVVKKTFDKSALFDLSLLLLCLGLDVLTDYVPSQLVMSCGMLAFVMASLFGDKRFFELTGMGSYAAILSNPYAYRKYVSSLWRMLALSALSVCVYLYVYLCPDNRLSLWLGENWIYFVIVLYLAVEIIVARLQYYKYKDCEMVPLVDESAKVVGVCPRPLVHDGSLWLHPVVHLHVINGRSLLLQLRPQSKKIQPGKWDTAVGGHISAGEKLEDSLKREVVEEIGLRDFSAVLRKQYVWECDVEREYVFSFSTQHSGPFKPVNVGEVDELRFWTVDELRDAMGKGVFTPNLEKELDDWVIDLLSK